MYLEGRFLHKYRASRPKIVQWIARWFLRLFGWKVDGFIPPLEGKENLIIIAGPHTSNWDGVFGFAAILGLDAKITFFGKHSLFTKPILGKFLKYMGGIPVDKTKPGSGSNRCSNTKYEKTKWFFNCHVS